MDVAWRYDREDSGKLPHHRQHGHRSGRRLPDRRRTDLGHPVSPGSVPFDRRQTTAETFRRGYLRLPPTVDARLVHRIDRPRTARQDQRRQGIAGTLRRRRFVGGGRTAAQSGRRSVGLHLRRYGPASQRRIRIGAEILRVDGTERNRRTAGDNSSPTWPA